MLPATIYRESGPFGTVLVGILSEQDQPVQYQLQILMRHRPAYLAPCYLRYRAGRPQICQEITGRQSMDEKLLPEELNPEFGHKLLQQIVADLLDARDRLLSLEQFALHPSAIYLDEQNKPTLIFWPVSPITAEQSHEKERIDPEVPLASGEQKDEPFAELLRIWIQSFRFSAGDADTCRQAWTDGGLEALASALLRRETASVTAIVADHAAANQANPVRHFGGQPLPKWLGLALCHVLLAALLGGSRLFLPVWPVTGKIILFIAAAGLMFLDLWQLSRRFKPATSLKGAKDLPGKIMNLIKGHEQTQTEDGDGQTVLLSSDPAGFRMAMLAEGKPGTPEEHEGLRAFILVDEFIIGRDLKQADLVLPDPGIGRLHARITRRAGSFFINDLGSKKRHLP